jgi:ribosomal protein S18 acetylase RimI-like enzyme
MIIITDMLISDLEEAIALWDSIPELHFPAAFDTPERLERFLAKNKAFSTIAKSDGEIVGALLCGNDGRRGFFYHIGVKPQLRKQGIAARMVGHSFEKLRKENIDTCFLFTNDFNPGAQAFWKAMGFVYAPQVMYQSRAI